MHKSLPKAQHFWLFEFFFKNEAFNQKSETVKLLGYTWTCSGDNIGLRKLIFGMPRAYSEAHEMACFQGLSALYTNTASNGRKFDLEKIISNSSKMLKKCLKHLRRVGKWLGTDIIHLGWIWDLLKRIDFQPHFWVFHTLFAQIHIFPCKLLLLLCKICGFRDNI